MTTGPYGITFLSGVHIPSLEHFHDHLLGVAAEIVAKGGETSSPLVFVLSIKGQLAIVPTLQFTSESLSNYQRSAVLEPMVRACAVVCEGWFSTRTADDPRPVPDEPRLDPERGEAVIVSILTAGRQALTFSPIKRPQNTVERARFEWLDESKTFKRASGRMVR